MLVGEEQLGAPLAYRLLGLAADFGDGAAQRVGAALGIEGAVDLGRAARRNAP